MCCQLKLTFSTNRDNRTLDDYNIYYGNHVSENWRFLLSGDYISSTQKSQWASDGQPNLVGGLYC